MATSEDQGARWHISCISTAEMLTPNVFPLVVLLTAIAAAWVLQWAAALFIPLVLSLLVAFSLNPLVRRIQRLHLPRHLAAAVVLFSMISAGVAGAYALREPTARAAQRLPEVSQRLRAELQLLRINPDGQRGALGALEEAADDLDAAASEVAGTDAEEAPRGLDIGFRQWIAIGSMSAVGWTGQALLFLFLVYFLLASGDLFKRKLVRLAGPSLARRRVTVSTLDDIHSGMERFLAITVGLNAALAAATAGAFQLYGLTSAPVWGLVGGLLNFIPYLGSAMAAVIFFAVAFVQFDSLGPAATVSVIWIGLSTLEGSFIKPWLIGQTSRINNVAIFTGLIFWGWTWGAWGLLLAFPILMAVKIVADHIDALHPISELLGT